MAGTGQGLGQLGGLTLIGLHVPEHRRAEANAILNIGGYIPAAVLPICTGYLIDAKGLAVGATAFADDKFNPFHSSTSVNPLSSLSRRILHIWQSGWTGRE
ncbi:hypothetical protein [Paenibacillus sp. SYP-B3998]|uniref:hypothetical protein n=1 Tax=Paenibacillus sp. SYP-B3998 TaxID=2678564 RepID=UPI0019670310|nr:hypothetical protein [Paenibacillus sp. SYP-B3998]